MGFQERLPSGLLFPLRRRFNPVVPQNVADGGVGDEVTDIGQGALDAIVTPICVFPSHAQHQLDNFVSNAGTSGILPLMGEIPLVRDQLPVLA